MGWHELQEWVGRNPKAAIIAVAAFLAAFARWLLGQVFIEALVDLLYSLVGEWAGISDVKTLALIFSYLIPFAICLCLVAWVYRLGQRAASLPGQDPRVEALAATDAKLAVPPPPPIRMPLTDLAAIATAKYDWNFQKEEDLLFFDFIDGIRHAVSDGVFELEGRKGCLGQHEDRKNFYFIVPIPKDHVRETQIDVPGFFKDDVSNYAIHTWSFSDKVSSNDLYCDIHIDNGAKGIAWLESTANEWKGRRAQANLKAEARNEEFRRELREQGVPHSVPDDSKQGRAWNPGDPPEGRKVE